MACSHEMLMALVILMYVCVGALAHIVYTHYVLLLSLTTAVLSNYAHVHVAICIIAERTEANKRALCDLRLRMFVYIYI